MACVPGTPGDDFLPGTNDPDVIIGDAGDDAIFGLGGEDNIDGGSGADTLLGGLGADRFVFGSAAGIGLGGSRDHILDFEAGGAGESPVDLIVLSGIDAISWTANKNDAFKYIGGAAFNGKAGERRVEMVSAGQAVVSGDTKGHGVADFELLLAFIGPLGSGHFLL
jgi:Ca2+-binding RTX toxin-like protein